MKQVERQNLPFLWGLQQTDPTLNQLLKEGLAASSVCCPQSLPSSLHFIPNICLALHMRSGLLLPAAPWKCPLELPGTLFCPLRQQHLIKTGALQGLSHSGFALTAALTFNNQLFKLHPNWACSCVNKAGTCFILHNFPLHPNLCSFCLRPGSC